MIRASSMVLLTVGSLAAVAFLRSDLGAQPPKKPAAERAPSDMKMECPMMAGLKGIDLFADSPAVLQADAKNLKLTEQQLEQLSEIEQSARQRARELLTDEQRQQLEESPDAPLSLMELGMRRMKHMQDGDKGQMCPMCMKMMRMKHDEGHHPPKKGNRE